MPVKITLTHPIIRSVIGTDRVRVRNRIPVLGYATGLTRTGNMISRLLTTKEGIGQVGFAELEAPGRLDFVSQNLPDGSPHTLHDYTSDHEKVSQRLARVGVEQVLFEGPVSRREVKKTLRQLLRKPPEVITKRFGPGVQVETLPDWLEPSDKTGEARMAKELKIALQLLKRHFPIEWDVDYPEVRSSFESASTKGLLLLLYFRERLGMVSSERRREPALELVLNAAAQVLSQRADLPRAAGLFLADIFDDAAVLQNGFERLKEGLTVEEAGQVFCVVQKRWKKNDYKKDAPYKTTLLSILKELAKHPVTSKEILIKIILGGFSPWLLSDEQERQPLEQLLEQVHSSALERIFSDLTEQELTELVEHKYAWKIPADWREKLFTHSLMPDDLTRRVLLAGCDRREGCGVSDRPYTYFSGVGAFNRLKEKGLLSQEDIAYLARQHTSEALLELLTEDQTLAPNVRVSLLENIADRRKRGRFNKDLAEQLILASLSALGDTLTNNQIRGLFPLGIQGADAVLISHPNFSPAARLMALSRLIPETSSEGAVQSGLVDSVQKVLAQGQSVFNEGDYNILLEVLASRRAADAIWQEILVAPLAKPAAPDLAVILTTQITPSQRKELEEPDPSARIVDARMCFSCRSSGCRKSEIAGWYTGEDIARFLAVLSEPKFSGLKPAVIQEIRQTAPKLADCLESGQGEV